MAVSIPIFTSQLEKSRESTDVANLRAAYAEGVAQVLTQDDGSSTWTKIYTSDGHLVDTGTGVAGKATQDGWQGSDPGLAWTSYAGKATSGQVIKVTYTPGSATSEDSVTVNIAS